jgi:hypothetical protein
VSDVISTHFNTMALARDHLEEAESLFYAVGSLLSSEALTPDALEQAARLAWLGRTLAQDAASQFRNQAPPLTAGVNAGGNGL